MSIKDLVSAASRHLAAGGDIVAASSRSEDGYTIGDASQTLPFRPGDIPVNPNLALSLTAVWACVSRISGPMSGFPVQVFRETGDGLIEDRTHNVFRLFNRRANKYQTARTMRKTTTGGALLWGNGYLEIQRNRANEPIALWPMLPWNTSTVRLQNKLVHRTIIDGDGFDVLDKNTLHVMDFALDGFNGLSPVQQAAHSVGLSMAAEDFGGKFFTNDAKSGGFVMIPGRLSSKGRKNVSDSMAEQGGLDNAHRIKVLEEGAKFINTTVPPEAAQFLGTREFQLAEMARLYNVPLHMLQAETKSTSWGSGLEQLATGFVQYTLGPWVSAWEAEINDKMFSKAEIDQGYHAKFNLTSLLRGDSKSRAEFYRSGITDGWMKRNEARTFEDLPRDDDRLDEYLIPLNYQTVDQSEQDAEADSGGDDEDTGEDTGDTFE